MSDNETIVRNFVAAWSRLDAEELLGYFTDDIVYHNMPMAPLSGMAMVRVGITTFLKDWTATRWELLNIMAAGNVVMTERVDHIEAHGKAFGLPVCGIFELRDGKIAVWRDYFDMGTYAKAFA
ncbi:MAG TPA: limonene-1,2-epoxide hydrolase family protein [Polymorphobacter sp.]|nr:limonene-1,2-epoxide hydrolase family protein [Polymorphobacter sp.]